MKSLLKVLAIAVALSAPASLHAQLLQFEEDHAHLAPIPLDAYADSLGVGMSPIHGEGPLALKSSELGCPNHSWMGGGVRNMPSGCGALYFRGELSMVFNVSSGFSEQFSFWHMMLAETASVSVYSEVDAGGSMLASALFFPPQGNLVCLDENVAPSPSPCPCPSRSRRARCCWPAVCSRSA